MKKYFIPGKDQEVKVGEYVKLKMHAKDGSNMIRALWEGEITEEIIPLLVFHGLLEEKEVDDGSDNDIDDNYQFSEITEMVELMSENLQILTDINKTLVEKIEKLEGKINYIQRGMVALLKDRKKDEGK